MSEICSIVTSAQKTWPDFLQFKNSRPISNLRALSKIIEESDALQLNNYLMNNNLHENFQSAYKVHYSRYWRQWNRCIIYVSYLLHLKLCLTIYYWIGYLDGVVLQGLYKNGLHPTYHLEHNLFKLNLPDLHYMDLTAPQGSVLGPLLYVLYTSRVANIIKRHNLMYQLYADDTQLHVSFKSGSDGLLSSAQSQYWNACTRNQ